MLMQESGKCDTLNLSIWNKRMIAEQKVIQTVQAVILGRKGRAVTIVQGMPESNVLKEGTS